MGLLSRKRTILAKIEGTYNTDPVPTGAANAILVRDNLAIQPLQLNSVQRGVIRTYLGASETLPTSVYGTAEFEVELAGSGTAGTAPAWGVLLRACGFGETLTALTDATYKPVSAAFESLTIYGNVDGVLHKLTGCRGTVSLDMSIEQIPALKFRFTGQYVAATDAAPPTQTLTAWQQPKVCTNSNTTGLTLHGFATAKMTSLSFDIANDVKFRPVVGAASEVFITGRNPSGNMVIDAELVATKDWFTSVQAATLGALSIVHGTVAGNKVQLDAPKVQVSTLQYGDRDGIATHQLGLVLTPNTGNDELVIKAF